MRLESAGGTPWYPHGNCRPATSIHNSDEDCLGINEYAIVLAQIWSVARRRNLRDSRWDFPHLFVCFTLGYHYGYPTFHKSFSQALFVGVRHLSVAYINMKICENRTFICQKWSRMIKTHGNKSTPRLPQKKLPESNEGAWRLAAIGRHHLLNGNEEAWHVGKGLTL